MDAVNILPWQDRVVRYRCDGFVSRADDMILYRIQASSPVICANFMADIHTVPGLEIPESYQKIAVQKHIEVTDDWILYESSNLDDRYFGMAIHIISNGTQKAQFGRIFVESANEITVMIRPFIKETSKRGLPKAKDWILSHSKSYDDMLASHIPLHAKLALPNWNWTDIMKKAMNLCSIRRLLPSSHPN